MNYKDQTYVDYKLEQLTNNYNRSLLNLSSAFKTKLNEINRLSISKLGKFILLTNANNSYNANVKKLTTEYNKQRDNLIKIISTSPNKALLIGINYTNTSNELYGCINDTINIQQLLSTKFDYKMFTVLTDQTNKKPSKQNIQVELTNLLVQSKAGDKLFFLYSGHGTNTADINKDEIDGQDELIVPLDATDISSCIIDDELNTLINKYLKKYVTLFMLFDSCFSGTILDLKYNYVTDDTNTLFINETVTDTIGKVFVISGCKDNQTSADAYVNYRNKNIYSGAMTYAFLHAMDTIKDVSLYDLINHMRNLLKTEGYDQIPQLSGGTFVDIKTEKVF
jgi:hypothetical protein